ncbi:MAG: CAP domain-containing protein [Candidatus Absconditabacterales bacterium]
MKKLIFLSCCALGLMFGSVSFARVMRLHQVKPPLLTGVALVFTGSQGSITVDTLLFQQQRLTRVNTVRSGLNIYSYILDNNLNGTAQAWSDYSKSRNGISHKRYNSKAYYDYNLIQKRFEEAGLMFSKKKGTKVVENIGRGYVRCGKLSHTRSVDCTKALIDATKTSWNFFMSEKGKSYAPHYKSIISEQYEWAGFGVSVDVDQKKYYITAHYSVPFVAR